MTNHYNQTYERRLETASKLLRSYRRLNGNPPPGVIDKVADEHTVCWKELTENWRKK